MDLDTSRLAFAWVLHYRVTAIPLIDDQGQNRDPCFSVLCSGPINSIDAFKNQMETGATCSLSSLVFLLISQWRPGLSVPVGFAFMPSLLASFLGASVSLQQ